MIEKLEVTYSSSAIRTNLLLDTVYRVETSSLLTLLPSRIKISVLILKMSTTINTTNNSQDPLQDQEVPSSTVGDSVTSTHDTASISNTSQLPIRNQEETTSTNGVPNSSSPDPTKSIIKVNNDEKSEETEKQPFLAKSDVNDDAERVKFAYWVPNVSGGLVISKIPQKTKYFPSLSHYLHFLTLFTAGTMHPTFDTHKLLRMWDLSTL